MKEQKHSCKYCRDCVFYYEYNHYSTTDYYCNYYEEEMRQYASKDYSSEELKKNKEYNYKCPYYTNIEEIRELAKSKVARGKRIK